MFTSKVSNVVISVGSSVAIFTSHKLQAKDLVVCHDCHTRRLPKARELPLYNKEDHLTVQRVEGPIMPLITEISSTRKKLFEYASYVDVLRKKAIAIYETGLAHSQSSYEYLKDEQNLVPRVLVIASGGLVGYLYARRGGVFKKMLFTSVGTGGVFSIFYPSLTREYFSSGCEFIKHQTNTALGKYGGYDTDKMVEDTNVKLERMKNIMKYENLMNKLNELFYKSKDTGSKILNGSTSSSSQHVEKEDINPDKDLYTTRT